MKPHRQSPGLNLAHNRLVAMSDDERTELTPDRLIASYGLTLAEAAHLLRSFQRRV